MTVALRETPRRRTRTPRRTTVRRREARSSRPQPPFSCGHSGEAAFWRPERFSAEWLDDPGDRQWRCPVCGVCLADVPADDPAAQEDWRRTKAAADAEAAEWRRLNPGS